MYRRDIFRVFAVALAFMPVSAVAGIVPMPVEIVEAGAEG